MIIYEATTDQFRVDVINNNIANKIKTNFINLVGTVPHTPEINSWINSLPKVKDLIELAELEDNIIVVEYQLPYNQNRIDVLLFGKDEDNNSSSLLLELKQWQHVEALEDEGNFVETFTGGNTRVVSHPSQQVKGYHNYLINFVNEFEQPPTFNLYSYAYCHNYEKVENEGLFDKTYHKLIDEFPLYTGHDTVELSEILREKLSGGDGWVVYNRFLRSQIRPSKKLLDNIKEIIKNESTFSLINEQIVAKNLIWSKARKAKKKNERSVIIVHGGPGTGKSLIALNVLADAAARNFNVLFGCKSQPFREGIKKLIGRDSKRDGRYLFQNLYFSLPSRAKENEFDLILIDEAHRIENSSNHRYTKPFERTDMPQIEQLIRCSKTSVFFIDKYQVVRSQETTSPEIIKAAAKKLNKSVSEVHLKTQFRCMGSNDYLLWLESLLGFSKDKRILKKSEKFDFRIYNSPNELYKELFKLNEEKENSARLTAGFCWPWSSNLDVNGEPVKDVSIGDFAMPWETHRSITKPPLGYVKWFEWAYKPEGIKQVGCIYTAQGFEFDYVGVIVGDDLKYDPNIKSLITDINATEDPTLKRNKDEFDHYVRNIYRVLMSRGMKGCFVYFVNKETEKYFREFIEVE